MRVATLLFVLTTACPAQTMDKPVKRTVVNLGPASFPRPYSGKPQRRWLTCTYYPTFMVKQLEEDGLKGNGGVEAVPFKVGLPMPPCTQKRQKKQVAISGGSFFFMGAKGPFLFLEGVDGDGSNGLPFRVFDFRVRKVVYSDSGVGTWPTEPETKSDYPPLLAADVDGRLVLHYTRAVVGPCSLPNEGLECWHRFQTLYGVSGETIPRCVGFEGGAISKEEAESPSAIFYTVSVHLSGRKSREATSGVLWCTTPM